MENKFLFVKNARDSGASSDTYLVEVFKKKFYFNDFLFQEAQNYCNTYFSWKSSSVKLFISGTFSSYV